MTTEFKLFGHVQPGALISAIWDSATKNDLFTSLTKEDFILLIGGTNDVDKVTQKNYTRAVREMSNCLATSLIKFN